MEIMRLLFYIYSSFSDAEEDAILERVAKENENLITKEDSQSLLKTVESKDTVRKVSYTIGQKYVNSYVSPFRLP